MDSSIAALVAFFVVLTIAVFIYLRPSYFRLPTGAYGQCEGFTTIAIDGKSRRNRRTLAHRHKDWLHTNGTVRYV